MIAVVKTLALASAILASSVATVIAVAANLTQQDAIVWSGVITTTGLAALNLYQKARETKRAQDAADLALTAQSDRARAAQLTIERQNLESRLKLAEAEADRWLKMYQSTKPTAPGGEGRPLTGQTS